MCLILCNLKLTTVNNNKIKCCTFPHANPVHTDKARGSRHVRISPTWVQGIWIRLIILLPYSLPWILVICFSNPRARSLISEESSLSITPVLRLHKGPTVLNLCRQGEVKGDRQKSLSVMFLFFHSLMSCFPLAFAPIFLRLRGLLCTFTNWN